MSAIAAPFVLFGADHLGALGLTALAALVSSLFVRKDPSGRRGRIVRFVLAGGLLAATLATIGHWWRLGYLTFWDVLPLHLCDFLILVAAFALVSLRQTPYELLYFWGCAGTLLALFSPDVRVGFPDPQFLTFFVLHGLVVVAAVMLTAGFGMRPAPGAVRRAFLITNGYAAFVALVNLIFGTNYLFLRRKPSAPTLLDWLGPWPVYILAADVLALALFVLLALPFRRRAGGQKTGSNEGNGLARARHPR